MPPKGSRKRTANDSSPPPAKRRATPSSAFKKGKQSLFDAIDDRKTAVSTPEETKAFLEKLGDSDSSDLSAVDSDDFEDVPLTKKRKSDRSDREPDAKDDEEEEEEEDEMDWEDAIQADEGASKEQDYAVADDDIGDVSISINEDGSRVVAGTELAASKLKKGPSKRERLVRNGTHCIHTQALMWHNAIRNSWLNDTDLQKVLTDGLTEGVWQEVDRWREDMGMPEQDRPGKSKKKRNKGKKDKKKGKNGEKRDGRDWGIDADRLEKGAVNMSRGDPLLRLLKILTAYWRKRFTVNAPGLRKQGYMPIERLAAEVNAWKKDHNDIERFGERLESVADLRRLAKTCEGSRDVGAQLFVALLRGLGLDVRLVANLQPAGIGWGKVEEAHPPKVSQKDKNGEDEDEEADSPRKKKPSRGFGKKKSTNKADLKAALTPTATRKSNRTSNAEIITIDSDDDEDSALSSVPDDVDDDSDASIIEVTPTAAKKSKKKYDRDLHYPHYWAEVISSVSNQVIPVDPIVLSTVATNGELLATFEPRGKLADQAKQVMCYTIAHAADGSAKDVTVRYLKKHQLPGRTKGYRMPVERIKVLNKRGKVRKYEDYDWFKTVMSVFERPQKKRTVADDLEESTDLKPFKPVDEKKGVEVESLQWYKQSAEFVLERHLRREEALLPSAKPVKTFTAGKGDKAAEEPVYRRKDVVNCKTAESWHKEGREIKLGEQPMKLVKMRAVTTMRKREIEEIERETGETAKQGLFARSQTDWIIPPPIGADRQIPRNAFGNIDVYVPSMVPKGAVHIPFKGTARVCRDLNISHAEACTGFEFGKRMAIPILTGVVVAEENEDAVMELWQEREAEKKRKEDTKREAQMLGLWRKFVMGMRIVERMKAEYAGSGSTEEINPFVRRAKQQAVQRGEEEEGKEEAQGIYESFADHAARGGGFFHEGEGEEDVEGDKKAKATITVTTDDVDMEGGGFLMDDEEQEQNGMNGTNATKAHVKPMSLAEAMKLREQANNEDEEEEELSEMEEEPVKPVAKPQRKAPSAKPATKPSASKKTPPAKRGRKSLKPPTPPSEDEEELDDLSDEQVEEEPVKSRTSRRSSGRSSVKKSPAKAKRVTSPYFSHEEIDNDDVELDDEEDDDGEEEVVKPRATTARTRGRAR
ncbi:hypothetical protein MBLNU457_6526t1 [Dothideomycetes sp. NU457]